MRNTKRTILITLLSIGLAVGLFFAFLFFLGASSVFTYKNNTWIINDTYYIASIDVTANRMLYAKACEEDVPIRKCSGGLGVAEKTVIRHWFDDDYIIIEVAPEYDGNRSPHEYDTVYYVIPLSEPVSHDIQKNYIGPLDTRDEISHYVEPDSFSRYKKEGGIIPLGM